MGKCHISQNIKRCYVIKYDLLADVQSTKLKIGSYSKKTELYIFIKNILLKHQ